MRLVVLLASCVMFAGVAIPVADWWLGPANVLPALVALVLCVVPAVVTLRLVERVAARSVEGATTAILVGIGLRMAAVGAGVVVLADGVARSGVSRDRFLGWVAVMYLVTLAVESVLMARVVTAAASGRPPARPAGGP